MQPYYADKLTTLYHGDCLAVMAELPSASFDAVICDPPYGTTACAWDSPIPFAPMWAALKRLIRPRAAVVLFGSQPFTSALVMSNVKWFRHTWVWNKKLSGTFHLAKFQPLKITEDVLVFGPEPVNYYPQMRLGILRHKGGHNGNSPMGSGLKPFERYESNDYYPVNMLEYGNTNKLNRPHPTQKPLALMEYLVKTYTNEGGHVLDFTCGSGTTLRACKNLNRYCVGIEQEERYCAVTARRLSPAFEEALPTDPLDDYGPLFAIEGATP